MTTPPPQTPDAPASSPSPNPMKPPRGPGRKLKLSPFLIKQAEEVLQKGVPQEAAAEILGIGKTTWFRWLQEADALPTTHIKAQFREAVTRARAHAEADMVGVLKAAGNTDWRAALAFLERAYPTRWAARKRVELAHEGSVRAEVTLEDLRRIRKEQDEKEKASPS